MASGERRLGSGRRGMTVLGKIPTPSVPKPINLPSQRLENRGLEPNVELVPRGTFSWGSAGRSNAVGVSKEEGPGIASSPPTSSVAWNVALKRQDLSTSSSNAGSLADSNQPSSAGNSIRPSSAPTAATTSVRASAKTKVEVQVQSSDLTAANPVILGSQESADLTPQTRNVPLNRPTSADGTVVDRDMHLHPGVNAHMSSAPRPGSGPEPFQHPGDGYNGRFVWQGELPAGPRPYPGPLPHEVYYSPFGVPHYGNVNDRDMVMVRMANGPGVHGSYPPHLIRAECFGPPGMYGGFRPPTGHVEQFAMSGNGAMGATSCTPGMSIGFFPDGNKYPFQEGNGQFGTVPYPGMQRDVDPIHHISSVSTYGTERNHRMSRTSGRHSHARGEHENYAKDGLSSFAMPLPERKITLLTKTPRVEASSTESIGNNSTLLLDSNQGIEGGQQKTDVPKIEAENVSTVFEVEGVKKNDEFLESKKLDGGVVKTSTRDVTLSVSETKQDCVTVNCSKENLSEVEAGVTETFPSYSPKTWRKAASRSQVTGLASAQKPLTSTHCQDSDSKAQMNHCHKSEVNSHGPKISKQAHSTALSEFVGTGSKSVCSEPTNPMIEEDITCRDDQKTKTKALNHKSEKEWRPKSPVVESKAPGLRVAKGGKRNERVCNAESLKEVLPQECSTESVLLEASSLLQTQKAYKRRVFRDVESSSPSVSSGINSDKEAPLCLIEHLDSSQSGAVEVSVEQRSTPSKNERTFVLEASSSGVRDTAMSGDQVLHADTMAEGLILKGDHKGKMRLSNHKKEKEWRPKSPAVDSTATSDNVSGSQASGVNLSSISVSDMDIKSISEQEGLQPLDTYDYEGQRAKLREIAAQRAKQRQKEEEERTKEQRAKALAKLDELNRRTSVNPTSPEIVEHGSVVCTDEAPSKKTKRKLNSSRRSFVDVPVQDSEKHHIDGEMVWEPVKNSTPIPAITAFHKNYSTKVGEDSMELSSTDMIPQNSRSKRDEPDRSSSKTAQKCQLHKSQTSTGSYEEQRQQSRRDRSIHEEESLPTVYVTQLESSSSKKCGVETRKGDARLHGGRRQTDSTQNQTGKGAFTQRNERKSTVEEDQEVERPKSSSCVSQIGDPQEKGIIHGKASSKRSQQSSEGQKQTKADEWPVSEEHSFAIGSSERKNLIHAGVEQHSAGNSRLGHKHRNEIEACFTIAQAQSFGIKQPMECTVSSDASFGLEKLGRSHVSWRLKSSNHLPSSNKPIYGLTKDMGNAFEESLDTPMQSQKSHKVKNLGVKEYIAGQHQWGLEERELSVVEEKRTGICGSALSDVTGFDANISKHEVEAKASESVKLGRSHNPQRQKNITNGSYVSKQAFMKEMNERRAESLAGTEEAFQEIADPTYLHSVSTGNPHKPVAHAKQSPRAGLGAPPWHKHRSVKPSNTNLYPVPSEEHSPSQVVSVSRHRLKSNVVSTQGWETEPFQESETLAFGHSRKGGSQLQAEPTPHLEANALSHKHQQVYSAKVTETISDPPLRVSSSKNRSNHTHADNRKMNRPYQAGPQAFRPREQHQEAEFEIGNNRGEQRASRGRDKPSRKGQQFIGCSTVAELDRRGAEPAIKTEISY